MLKLQDFYRFYHFFWREGSSDIKLKLTKKKLRDNKKQVQACISPTIKTDWFATSTWIFQKFHHIDTFPPGSEETEKKTEFFVQLRILEMLIFQLCCSIHFFPGRHYIINARFGVYKKDDVLWCFTYHLHPKKTRLIHFNTLLSDGNQKSCVHQLRSW